MPTRVQDSDALINEIIPEDRVAILEKGRREEIIQPLRDLGYLPDANGQLEAAIRLFRKEYLEINLIPEYSPNFMLLPEADLESEELNLLHTLVSMDGDFSIDQLPEVGTKNLIGRIIHYRLSIHELIDFEMDQAFGEATIAAIQKPKSWIKNLPDDILGCINLLGNIPELIQHIALNKNGGLHKKVVVFKYHKARTLSKFAPPVSPEIRMEVVEDEQESEIENESRLLQLESEIDNTLQELKQLDVFDDREQFILAKDTKKNNAKRLKMVQIEVMFKQVHTALVHVNDEISDESDKLTRPIKDLTKLKNELAKEQKVLQAGIKQKDGFIKQFKQDEKKLKKKERQLKRRIKNGGPQHKIDQLQLDIAQIKSNVRQVDQLEIEKSQLHLQLIPVDEELKRVHRKLSSLNKQLEKLIADRAEIVSRKQRKLEDLKTQLEELEVKVDKLKFSFRGRMRKVLDRDFYKNVVKKEIFQNRNRVLLNTLSQDEYNNYLIRLIQIFQWTNGYYYGQLDSSIGDRTFSALDDMVNYSKGLRLKFILARLSENHSGSKGFWLLNIKYLFDKLAAVLKEKNLDLTTKDLLKKYEEEFLDKDGKSSEIGNEVTDKGYEEIVEENQEDLRKPGVLRRIYYGIKSIAATLFDALVDLIKIIRRGIKQLIYLVKNLIKIVYKEIREGVRRFKDGMKFLFGKRLFETPTGTGSAILTKFDFDFDTTIFVPDEVSFLEYQHHKKLLFRYSNNLDFTMVLTGKILKWVFRLLQLGTPIGWGRLALKIAIHYKNLIIKWLVNLGKRLTQTFISIKYKFKEEPVIVEAA